MIMECLLKIKTTNDREGRGWAMKERRLGGYQSYKAKHTTP